MNTQSNRFSSLPCRPPPHPGCAGSTRETLMLPAHPRRNGSRPLLVSPPPPARRIFTHVPRVAEGSGGAGISWALHQKTRQGAGSFLQKECESSLRTFGPVPLRWLLVFPKQPPKVVASSPSNRAAGNQFSGWGPTKYCKF